MIQDLQTAIDCALLVQGVDMAVVRRGNYAGHAVLPSGVWLMLEPGTFLRGSVTVPADSTLIADGVTLQPNYPSAAMRYKADGSLVLNARLVDGDG